MNLFKTTLIVIATCVISINAYAGVYANELSKCLVESTSVRDKTVLIQWTFSSLSHHPNIKQISSVSKTQSEQINRKIANLFTKLITKACSSETRKAFEYEGELALEKSFEFLGKIAGKELFLDPRVEKESSSFKKYLNESKFEHLFVK